jgi:hypothetical protein
MGGAAVLATAGLTATAAPAVAGPILAGPGQSPISAEDRRLPRVLTVDYTFRDYEVVDYDFYSLDFAPRLRFRGPRFDPRQAASGGFFTAFGSAHTLGVFSPVTYTDILSQRLALPGWNVGAGGISASFYNAHPAIIEQANKGRFAIVQITAARMVDNDRIQSTPAAQLVIDRKHDDLVSPELAWARIAREEPERMESYIAQSRANWVRDHQILLKALTVPVVLLWFSARPMDGADKGTLGQVGSTAVTAFPQYIEGSDVRRIRRKGDAMAVCVTSRNAGHPLVSRFTGEAVSVNHRLLTDGRGPDFDLIESANTYYPSPEMQADAADSLLPVIRHILG